MFSGSRYDPGSNEWFEKIANPSLRLMDTMRLLADGWAPGLLTAVVFFWSWALSHLTLAINTAVMEGQDIYKEQSGILRQRNQELLFMTIAVFFPLLIALDVATTSTWCDVLIEQLNTAGIIHSPKDTSQKEIAKVRKINQRSLLRAENDSQMNLSHEYRSFTKTGSGHQTHKGRKIDVT